MKSFAFPASLLFLSIAHFQLQAQDDLLSDLRSDQNVDPGYVPSIFKSTRILNSHSVETLLTIFSDLMRLPYGLVLSMD